MRVKTREEFGKGHNKSLYPYGVRLSIRHINELADKGFTIVSGRKIDLNEVTDYNEDQEIEEEIFKEVNNTVKLHRENQDRTREIEEEVRKLWGSVEREPKVTDWVSDTSYGLGAGVFTTGPTHTGGIAELNDKGIRKFATGSVREDDSNKPLPSDLHPYVRLRYGYHMRHNAKKHSKGNWELGQPNKDLLESLHRHLAEYELGCRKEDHLSAILFGVKMIMLNEMREGVDTDAFYNLKNNKDNE